MCDERERLIGYVYDECDPAERREIAQHLEECSTCRTEIGDLRGVRQDLLAWEVEGGPAVWRPFVAPVVQPWYRQVPAWAMAAAATLMFLIGAAGGFVTQSLMRGAPARCRSHRRGGARAHRRRRALRGRAAHRRSAARRARGADAPPRARRRPPPVAGAQPGSADAAREHRGRGERAAHAAASARLEQFVDRVDGSRDQEIRDIRRQRRGDAGADAGSIGGGGGR